jgi:hypothetical protein
VCRDCDFGPGHERHYCQTRRGEVPHVKRVAHGDAPIGIETDAREVVEAVAARQKVQGPSLWWAPAGG